MKTERELKLEGALTALVEEYCDYMLINHLGDPEQQHNIIRAREALSDEDAGGGERRTLWNSDPHNRTKLPTPTPSQEREFHESVRALGDFQWLMDHASFRAKSEEVARRVDSIRRALITAAAND